MGNWHSPVYYAVRQQAEVSLLEALEQITGKLDITLDISQKVTEGTRGSGLGFVGIIQRKKDFGKY